MEEILKAIQEFKEELKNEIQELRNEMTERFNSVDEKLDAIATTSNDDIVTVLERIDRKMNYFDKDIELITNKVGNHERILNRSKN